MSVSQRPPIPSLIPESAPFTPEQRTWLNGLFAGLFGLPENVTPVSNADAARLLAGLLDGTPTSSQTGTYSNIIISASNGQYTSALPSFSVVVTKAATTASTGAATIDWTPPSENTNGTKLTNLAGFRIYYGTSAASLNQMVQVASATETTYTISNLAAGTWYFAGVAYTTAGTQSAMSNVVSAAIP